MAGWVREFLSSWLAIQCIFVGLVYGVGGWMYLRSVEGWIELARADRCAGQGDLRILSS